MNQILLLSKACGALKQFIESDVTPPITTLCYLNSEKIFDSSLIDEVQTALNTLGCITTTVDLESATAEQLATSLQASSIVCVVGNDPFALLERVKSSGLNALINRLMREAKRFVGIGAGAIIAGPEINMLANVGKPTQAAIGESIHALGIVKFIPLPHFNDDTRYDYENIIEKYQGSYMFATFTDEQAITVTDDGLRRIIFSASS